MECRSVEELRRKAHLLEDEENYELKVKDPKMQEKIDKLELAIETMKMNQLDLKKPDDDSLNLNRVVGTVPFRRANQVPLVRYTGSTKMNPWNQ